MNWSDSNTCKMKTLLAVQHSMIWGNKFINVGEILWDCSDHLGEACEETDTFGIAAELN